MRKKLVILGAGGHGRVCAEIASMTGYEEILFLDDGAPSDVSVSGKIEELEKYVPGFDVFVGVGNNGVRRALFERAAAAGADFATLIHPSAVVSPAASVGRGTVIVAGAVVNCGAVIGDGVIVNTCASVDHDCKIGDFTHIAVGAHIAGQADVGEGCFFGAGSAVIQCVTVCAECVIGAGAAVVGDITERGTYVGVPARRIK